MEHRLEAELTLSGSLPSSVHPDELIPRVASEAIAHTIGARGQGRLAEWKLEGERLRVVLESSGPRPHQALLAFVRRLSEELGRAARVGSGRSSRPGIGPSSRWTRLRKRRSLSPCHTTLPWKERWPPCR